MTIDPTVLDLSTLDELKEILEEGLDELIEEYLADTPSQISHLHGAAQSGDLDALASASHALKGSSGNLGISAVYTLCQQLEQEAKAGTVSDAGASVAAIEEAFSRAKDELAVYLAG